MKTTDLAGLLLAVVAVFGCTGPSASGDDAAEDEDLGQVTEAVTCDPDLEHYPVAGAHNGGYDSHALNFTCPEHPAKSPDNSDYIGGSHFGNDIFGAKGTTIVAAVAGTVVKKGQTSTSGRRITIRDKCGWHYFYAHLNSYAAGIELNSKVKAGDKIGTLGNSGAENTSPHLHFSIYPEAYEKGIDPFPHLKKVDKTSCASTCTAHCEGQVAIADDCSKDDCSAKGKTCVETGKEARCVMEACSEQPTKAHEVCLAGGELGHCTAQGALTTEKCPEGLSCKDDSQGVRCVLVEDSGTTASEGGVSEAGSQVEGGTKANETGTTLDSGAKTLEVGTGEEASEKDTEGTGAHYNTAEAAESCALAPRPQTQRSGLAIGALGLLLGACCRLRRRLQRPPADGTLRSAVVSLCACFAIALFGAGCSSAEDSVKNVIDGQGGGPGQGGAAGTSAAGLGGSSDSGLRDSGAEAECGDGSCEACGAEGQACCSTGCGEGLECSAAAGNICVVPTPAADTGVGDEDAAPAVSTCVFAPREAALVLFYGVMNDDGNNWLNDLNYKFANPKLDVVFVMGGNGKFGKGAPSTPGDPGTGEFKNFHDHCLRLAYHMSIGETIACLRQRDDLYKIEDKKEIKNLCAATHVTGASGAEDLAAFWKHQLELGWDYIAIDEIKDVKLGIKNSNDTIPSGMTDDHTANVNPFTAALKTLAANGFDKRVITFFVPHNDDVCTDPPPYENFKKFFNGCVDHCRTIMHELYFTTKQVENGLAKNFACVASALHNKTGINGINKATTAILAAGNDGTDPDLIWKPFDDPPCDIAPWPANHDTCDKLPGSGGLKRQLDAMHDSDSYARYWRGVGFYKLGAVRGNSVWSRQDFVESTVSRLEWWALGN